MNVVVVVFFLCVCVAKEWPRVRQKIEVIRSKENKLSNRFYPYANLTTAVFSMDDDITMLTVDELEFAYKVQKECGLIGVWSNWGCGLIGMWSNWEVYLGKVWLHVILPQVLIP